MYIIFSILILGFLIAIHEFGHFIAARIFGVGVNEFAIGMGPKILKKQGKKTLYSLRLIPFGGFCEMVGEDEEEEGADRPDSFNRKAGWKRIIILVAGAFMNFVAGFLILVIVYFIAASGGNNYTTAPTVTGFMEGFPLEGEEGLMAGDTIYEVNGERVYYFSNFNAFMYLNTGDTVDLVVIRDGEKVTLGDLPLRQQTYVYNGETVLKYGLLFEDKIEMTTGRKLQYAWYNTIDYARQVRISVQMIARGQAGISDLTGVVGVIDMMNDVGQEADTLKDAVTSILSIGALIAVNLGIFNLLPIPGLDGGRILVMFVSWAYFKIAKRKLNAKYEGYVNFGGFVVMMGLMIFVLFNDVVRIIGS